MNEFECLSWREVELLAALYQKELAGLFVERFAVPERTEHPGGFIKSEWLLRLSGRKEERTLLFSVRPRAPYVGLYPGKGPRTAAQGTQPVFSLTLNKHLKGSRLTAIEPVPRDRTLILWFSAQEKLGLVLSLFPSSPEALLIKSDFSVIARTRVVKTNAHVYLVPDGLKAPTDAPLRKTLLEDSKKWLATIELQLSAEAFERRWKICERELKDLQKQIREKIRQNETAMKGAEKEGNWLHYGDLLKASLHEKPSLISGVYRVKDFETESIIEIPGDPKLGLSEQADQFYHLARRKKRRYEESKIRLESLAQTRVRLEKAMAVPPTDWKDLEAKERLAQIQPVATRATEKKSKNAWLGKIFTSKDGSSIFVGRSKDENLELTFKVARGNDLWMHVRGKPGAHVLVPIHSKKSVSLETLLDAANLCIYYSGGEKWGKTEVDYTYKKYVKRIKDSSEASYTNNKTLIIEPDSKRIRAFTSQNS